MIGCHLLLIVGGGGSICLIEPSVISDQYEGRLGARPGPWAPGSGLSIRGEESAAGTSPALPCIQCIQGILHSSVSGASAVPVSHGGSRPGWDEDGATLHPAHSTHWHTLAHTGTGHGVTAAQWAALNRAGTMYCHASSTTRPPAAWDRSGYQWLNKAKWHITPSQVRCQVEFLNFDIKASRSQD